MGSQYLSIWNGKVYLECSGSEIVTCVNEAIQRDIHIEEIYWVDEHKARLIVGLKDVFRLIRHMRKHKVRVKVTKKKGLPFVWKRVKKRRFFLIGFGIFFFLIFICASLVWKVEIHGVEKVSKHQIASIIKEKGVYVWQWKARLPDQEEIQYELLTRIPRLSWVGYKVEGTRVVVTVVEKKLSETPKPEDSSAGPIHLVAKKNAMIVDMRVEQGNPLVEPNDMVRKGQILISGQYGLQGQSTGKIAGAKGTVTGEVWYESTITIPLEQKRKVYTGVRKRSRYPYIGNLVMYLPWGHNQPFPGQYETIQHVHTLYIGSLKLPLGWVDEEYMGMEWVTHRLTLAEAIRQGIDQAKNKILQSQKDGKILSEKVLHQESKGGKVYLKVHFDAVEDIGLGQPIVPIAPKEGQPTEEQEGR